MWLTDVSIRRPVFITMIVLAMAVLGLKSLMGMPVDLFPNIDIPYVTVVTTYPAAGPEEVERLVSDPLEKAVSTINNVDYVQSISQSSMSLVLIAFKIGTDVDVAAADVRDSVTAARGQLPKDAEDPVVQKLSIAAMPVMELGVSSRRPLMETYDLCDHVITPRIQRVAGVASVSLGGGEKREIQVRLDADRLRAYSLSSLAVNQAIAQGNLNLPAGEVKGGREQYAVRTVGELGAVAQLANVEVPLPADQTGRAAGTVQLRQLGDVVDTIATRTQYARANGEDSVGITIQKQSGTNTVRVADGVLAEVKRVEKDYPFLRITVAMDSSTFIRRSVNDLTRDLASAVVLVGIVVFLFLRNVRSTFIVCTAIPTCLISTFIMMRFGGFTVNFMTLLALALVVGILVDDSIVVLENIYRHMSMKKEPKVAALDGRTEIGLAAITLTATDVVVFVPVAFMGGIVGQFFRQFGLSVATATLLSLFISFTLTPMLASRWMRAGAEGSNPSGEGIQQAGIYRVYRRMLAWSLKHRWHTLAIGGVALVLSGLPLATLPKGFMPTSDQGMFALQVEMPAGTNLETTNWVVKEIDRRLAQRPDVEVRFAQVGTAEAGAFGAPVYGGEYGQITLKLVPRKQRRPIEQIREEVKRSVADIPGIKALRAVDMGAMGGGEQPVQVELTGPDIEGLRQYAEAVKGKLAESKLLTDLNISYRAGRPEFRVTVDRGKAAGMDLSVAQVASVLRTAVDGTVASTYREAGEEYDIRVLFADAERLNIDQVGALLVGSREGHPILLKDVAKVGAESGPIKIDRKNRERLVLVSANMAPGVFLSQAQQVVEAALANVPRPPDVRAALGGQMQHQQEEFKTMFGALWLAVPLVYMVMAALFGSVLYPFIIMLSLPMAAVGAFLALGIAHSSVNIVSLIGLIMLMGLVTKNAILLVDYTNTLRSRGFDRATALLAAGPVRLRPVLMTTATMVFGMLPIALGIWGEGSEIKKPLAVCVIGGLIVSTLLTLLVVPVVYTYFDNFQQWFGARTAAYWRWSDRFWAALGRKRAPARPEEAPAGGASGGSKPSEQPRE